MSGMGELHLEIYSEVGHYITLFRYSVYTVDLKSTFFPKWNALRFSISFVSKCTYQNSLCFCLSTFLCKGFVFRNVFRNVFCSSLGILSRWVPCFTSHAWNGIIPFFSLHTFSQVMCLCVCVWCDVCFVHCVCVVMSVEDAYRVQLSMCDR